MRRWRWIFLLFACAVVGVTGFALGTIRSTCELTLELVEEGSTDPIPGIIRLVDASGNVLLPENLVRRGLGVRGERPILDWSVLNGRATIRLPQEKIKLKAVRGLETEMSTAEFDLSGLARAEAQITLRRFYDATAKGYASANTHVHLQRIGRYEAERYLQESSTSDELDIVFVSFLARINEDLTYISNHFTREDFERLSSCGTLFGNGEEHRHNFNGGYEGYGHVMFLNLKKLVEPVSIGPGIMKSGTDGIPLQQGIDTARRDGAAVVWCHNKKGIEDLPNVVTGRVDGQNIYDSGTISGSYAETFYRYLNVGIKMPFSTGTDWFIFDFGRAYGKISGKTSIDSWLGALRAGRTYITNGPLLEFDVDRQGLGETLRLSKPRTVKVRARAFGRDDFQQIELVQNGKVVHTTGSHRTGGHHRAEFEIELPVDKPAWLALRTPVPPHGRSPEASGAPKNIYGRLLYSHTSAIYLEVGGQNVYDSAEGKRILDEMETHRAYIAKHFLFANDAERDRVLRVHDHAIERWRSYHKLKQAEPQR
ncbi:MAG: CehA/McbA family metallohydrolase [Planctomycetes bacterium]|nr:CehA/McbA family metallohydrolase [Planctomycetota bacterium]